MIQQELEEYSALHYSVFDDAINKLDGQLQPLLKGNDSFFSTVFHLTGHGWLNIFLPWTITTLNAVWWTVFLYVRDEFDTMDFFAWRVAFTLGISSTLGFLLTFRLNRSILRFWEGMKSWGNIVSLSRSLVSGILSHGRDEHIYRDRAVIWTAATCLLAKEQIRKSELVMGDVNNLLTKDEIEEINHSEEPFLYAAHEVRQNLKLMLDVVNPARASETRQLEGKLDSIIHNVGVTMNIVKTPMPLVYVTNLRTFLMVYLLSLPYFTEDAWKWATIPVVSITALLFLSIDGASIEVENPFELGMVNDLDLDGYCESILNDFKMLVKKMNIRDGVIPKGQAA